MPFNQEYGGGIGVRSIGHGLYLVLESYSVGGDMGSYSTASICLLREAGETLEILGPDGCSAAHKVWCELEHPHPDKVEDGGGEAAAETADPLAAFRTRFTRFVRVTDVDAALDPPFNHLFLEVTGDRGSQNYPG